MKVADHDYTHKYTRFRARYPALFRESDKEAMEFAFNLWDYQDVRIHAEHILERIEEGSMPCEREWPQEQMDLLRRWIAAGMPA